MTRCSRKSRSSTPYSTTRTSRTFRVSCSFYFQHSRSSARFVALRARARDSTAPSAIELSAPRAWEHLFSTETGKETPLDTGDNDQLTIMNEVSRVPPGYHLLRIGKISLLLGNRRGNYEGIAAIISARNVSLMLIQRRPCSSRDVKRSVKKERALSRERDREGGGGRYRINRSGGMSRG